MRILRIMYIIIILSGALWRIYILCIYILYTLLRRRLYDDIAFLGISWSNTPHLRLHRTPTVKSDQYWKKLDLKINIHFLQWIFGNTCVSADGFIVRPARITIGSHITYIIYSPPLYYYCVCTAWCIALVNFFNSKRPISQNKDWPNI